MSRSRASMGSSSECRQGIPATGNPGLKRQVSVDACQPSLESRMSRWIARRRTTWRLQGMRLERRREARGAQPNHVKHPAAEHGTRGRCACRTEGTWCSSQGSSKESARHPGLECHGNRRGDLVLASKCENQRLRDERKPAALRQRWLARNDAHLELFVAPEPEGFGAEKGDRAAARAVAGWVYGVRVQVLRQVEHGPEPTAGRPNDFYGSQNFAPLTAPGVPVLRRRHRAELREGTLDRISQTSRLLIGAPNRPCHLAHNNDACP
jgi:hypothetical protein